MIHSRSLHRSPVYKAIMCPKITFAIHLAVPNSYQLSSEFKSQTVLQTFLKISIFLSHTLLLFISHWGDRVRCHYEAFLWFCRKEKAKYGAVLTLICSLTINLFSEIPSIWTDRNGCFPQEGFPSVHRQVCYKYQ